MLITFAKISKLLLLKMRGLLKYWHLFPFEFISELLHDILQDLKELIFFPKSIQVHLHSSTDDSLSLKLQPILVSLLICIFNGSRPKFQKEFLTWVAQFPGRRKPLFGTNHCLLVFLPPSLPLTLDLLNLEVVAWLNYMSFVSGKVPDDGFHTACSFSQFSRHVFTTAFIQEMSAVSIVWEFRKHASLAKPLCHRPIVYPSFRSAPILCAKYVIGETFDGIISTFVHKYHENSFYLRIATSWDPNYRSHSFAPRHNISPLHVTVPREPKSTIIVKINYEVSFISVF